MRILLVHNRYRSGAPGGEDLVFAQERDYLIRAGHDVVIYERSNDEMSDQSLVDMARVAWGLWSARRTRVELAQIIREFRPDVAHFHNLFPLIGIDALEVCAKSGVPIVYTLHNYRLVCAAATHFRNDRVCTDCTSQRSWPAALHRCYRQSAAASAVVAASLSKAWRAGVYHQYVDRFIALTAFASKWLQAQGIPSAKIAVKANAVASVANVGAPRSDHVVFAGRLSSEKGLSTLLDAWIALPDVPLKIIGSGPLESALAVRARQLRLPIEFLGYVPHEDVLSWVATARAVIVPSLWFEGQPLSILEAWGSGTPVIGSRVGGIEELLGNDERGLTFPPGDAPMLAAAVRRLFNDPVLAANVVLAARRRIDEMHSVDRTVESLEEIYKGVLRCAV